MFRKLVANLPFSPSLVGQLGFYARRLRQEEMTRRIGLIFTALALTMQSFAIFSPPESANAASPADIIYGGVSSVADILSVYDASARGNGDFNKIINYAGITRSELAATQPAEINSFEYGHSSNTNVWLSWGRLPYISADLGEVRHDISGTTVYSRPLWRYDTTGWNAQHGSNYPAFRGYSAAIGPFAIKKNGGSLLTTRLPIRAPACSAGSSCQTSLHREKSATNLTQGSVDATKVTAQSSDRIQFTLSLTNQGPTPIETDFADSLRDTMEYATIQDNGGASLKPDTKLLSWGQVSLKPGERTSRSFVVKVADTIPTTPRGISEPGSFDCTMTNTFGNTIAIPVACQTPKVLEASIQQLPRTGPDGNIIFAGALASVSVYFYARTRQLSKEIRLIRKEFNMGTL